MRYTLLCLLTLLSACDDQEQQESSTESEGMSSAQAELDFHELTFSLAGEEQIVSINGLPVEVLKGAIKVDVDKVKVLERRGVRFSQIFERAGFEIADETPINCIARDGWDPLRTRLENDRKRLPSFAFLRDRGYIYVGNPGDKDPLYPEMEGHALMVDYDLSETDELPPSLGSSLSDLNFFRWKMVERVDNAQYGVIEIDP